MLLSFSVPSMLPMLSAGLRQRAGEDIGNERVKRQTIRARGSRAVSLISRFADQSHRWPPFDLHLWWKSRSAERELIGRVGPMWTVYPIVIQDLRNGSRSRKVDLAVVGGKGWRKGQHAIFWNPRDRNPAVEFFAYADGFESVEAFRDFFVPNPGDSFEGVLFRW